MRLSNVQLCDETRLGPIIRLQNMSKGRVANEQEPHDVLEAESWVKTNSLKRSQQIHTKEISSVLVCDYTEIILHDIYAEEREGALFSKS